MIDLVTVGEGLAVGRVSPSGLSRFLPLGVGGAELNVAVALRNAGRAVRFITRVGRDPFGDLVTSALIQAGVDSIVETDESAATGFYLRTERIAGRRAYYYRTESAGSRLPAFETVVASVRDARYLHLTGITAALRPENVAAMMRLIDVARSVHCTVTFDVNFRPKLWSAERASSSLLQLARRSDLVFIGADEAHALWRVHELDQLRTLIPDAELIYKDGDRLAVQVATGSAIERVEITKANVVDSVGAGDAFAAGYLYASLSHMSGVTERVLTGHAFACEVMESAGDVLGPDAVARALMRANESSRST